MPPLRAKTAASLLPSGEKAMRNTTARPASKNGAGAAPGFISQIALVPERLERKASVPSGAKLGDQDMPLAGSMISGWLTGVGLTRARFSRLGSVSNASRPPRAARWRTLVAVV